jgi:hypothetical protein
LCCRIKSKKRGDIDTLRKICADGLLASFRARIVARQQLASRSGTAERLEWTLHQYTRFARVVAHRAVRLPMYGDACGQRQAVVRIRARQSLARIDAATSQRVPGTGEPRDVTEYVVIQRRVLNGREYPWEVWGTTQETSG